MLAIAVIILVGGLVAVTCALTYQSKRCGKRSGRRRAIRSPFAGDSQSAGSPVAADVVDLSGGIMTEASKSDDSVYYSSAHVRPLTSSFKTTCAVCRPNRKRREQCDRCRRSLSKDKIRLSQLSNSLRSLKRRHRKMSQRKVALQQPQKRSLSRALTATSSSFNGFHLKPRLSDLSLCSHVSYLDSLERKPQTATRK